MNRVKNEKMNKNAMHPSRPNCLQNKANSMTINPKKTGIAVTTIAPKSAKAQTGKDISQS